MGNVVEVDPAAVVDCVLEALRERVGTRVPRQVQVEEASRRGGQPRVRVALLPAEVGDDEARWIPRNAQSYMYPLCAFRKAKL